jgi:hypothetical protein
MREGGVDLTFDDRPQTVGQLIARAGVEVDRVEHHPPHVVLPLVVAAVADPDRPRLVQLLLLELALAPDPLHDLKLPFFGFDHIGDEVEGVVGLLVETECVQRPQHES